MINKSAEYNKYVRRLLELGTFVLSKFSMLRYLEHGFKLYAVRLGNLGLRT
jgi:hypothetical protein